MESLLKMDQHTSAQTGSSNSEDDSFLTYQENLSLSSNSRRQRVTFDQDVKSLLIESFSKCQYPDYTQRVELAEKAGVTESRIQVWFQNRRTRLRRKNHVIAKPRNLPGPMVGSSFKAVGWSPDSESPGRPQPLACVVQPQPRAGHKASGSPCHAIKCLSFKSQPNGTLTTAESSKAHRHLAHSVDRILKPVSGRKQLDMPTWGSPGNNQESPSSSSSSSSVSQSSHVVEITPIIHSDFGSGVASQQEEPLDLSLKKYTSPTTPLVAPLAFPWFSVFPSGFCLNPVAPAAATALSMKHTSQ